MTIPDALRQRWRPGFPAALMVLVLAPTAGAALLAGTHPARDDAYSGSATVLVLPPPPSSGESLALRTQRLASVMRSPSALLAARRAVGLRVGERVDPNEVLVRALPRQGVVEVSVPAPTPAEAENTANALVTQSIALVSAADVRPTREGIRIVGDFELDFDGWEPSGEDASAVTFDRNAPGRYNRAGLRIECRRSNVCGAVRTFDRRFAPGGFYVASFWLRSRHTGTPIEYSFGAGADAKRGTVIAARNWTRHVVRWTPTRAAESAGVIVQTRPAQPVTFDLDGVTLGDPRSSDAPKSLPLPSRQEEELFRDHVSTFAAAAEAQRARGNATGRWALAGAATGLAVGAAALGAAAAARRRRHS